MRCYSAMAFSALFCFAHLQSNVAAVPQLGDMEPLYVFTPGPAPGNCDNYKSDLQNALRDAIALFTAATASILYLNQPMPGVLHPLNRRKWKAWAQVMNEIFNIAVDTKTGLQLPNSPAQGVLDNFNAMINAHNYVPPGSGPYKYWFFCNDDWFEYKSPPTEEEMASWDWLASMNDGLIAKVRANGWWNGTGGTAAHPYHIRMAAGPGDSAATGYTCAQSDARAFVLRGEPVLVFCPRAFNTVPYKTITQAINAPTFKKPGAFLEEFDAWGGTMSHEWGHLVLGILDEIASDYFGQDLKDDREVVVRMYGFGRISQTARSYPDRARKTADAYTRYSEAVYYTQINQWGLQYVTGRGKSWRQS